MDYFNYQRMADEAGLTAKQLQRLVKAVEREFPSDPMLVELHLLRACRAIRDKAVTLEQAVAESEAESDPTAADRRH
ncbi:MAG: hypothetical protein WD042_01235 [Phycisphaeraceae bacterium]